MSKGVKDLQDQINLLRKRSLKLQSWREFSRGSYGAMVKEDLKEQIERIREAYGRIDLSAPGHDLALAQLQGREADKTEYLAFLENVDSDKKSIDKLIDQCEVRISQLNDVSGRRGEEVIEPIRRQE